MQWRAQEAPAYQPMKGHKVSAGEQAIRTEMVQKLRRGCEHALLFGANGVCSARMSTDSFLITPEGMDNALLEEGDIVFVRGGVAEAGKRPARESALHAAIYAQHASIHAVFSAAPANVAAFASAKERFETSTVPESYYMLRSVPTRTMEDFLGDPVANATLFSEKMPVVLFENSRIVTTGASLFTALDRLEVAEATAASILVAREAGKVIFLSEGEIQALKTTFHLA